MQKCFLVICCFLFACRTGEKVEAKAEKEEDGAYYIAEQKRNFYYRADSALFASAAWRRSNRLNARYAIVADLNMHSGLHRIYVKDIKENRFIDSGLVSHGSGRNGFSATAEYSNVPDSYLSSAGRYRIGNKYHGQFGEAYKLHGLDSANSNAFQRYIVFHSYVCVPDQPTYPQHICNSQGCPMVSPAFLDRTKTLIDTSRQPLLLWILN